MLKVKIYAPGRTKEAWLQEALSEYEKRLSRAVQVEWVLLKEAEWEQTVRGLPSWIALDVAGELVDSRECSQRLMRWFEKGGSRMHIAMGGPDGWPKGLLERSGWRWSLSPLTFTHQITRLLLLEQLYRAMEIAAGSGYHKEDEVAVRAIRK